MVVSQVLKLKFDNIIAKLAILYQKTLEYSEI